jgi:hypothetical protein
MSIRREKLAGTTLAAAALALVVTAGVPSTALAGPDQLKGGSVDFFAQKSKGLKIRPSIVTLPITGGDFDPVNGSGAVQVAGKLKFISGKHKAKVSIRTLNFGANGSPGTIDAKIGKDKVRGFGTVSGGTLARDGWGARLDDATVRLGKKGSRALSRAFSGKHGKGKASAAKAGKTLGTVSASTVPLTVEVVPGSGSIKLFASLDSGSLTDKLPSHCVDTVTPTPLVSEAGVAAIPPATLELVPPPPTFTFPVSGGAVAPDFSDGRLITAGGQKVTKNNGPLTPGMGGPPCSTSAPPIGTSILSTDFEAEFSLNALASYTTLPTGPIGLGALGVIDWSTGTRSIDPDTKKLTVSGATVRLDSLSAFVLGQVLPNVSGDPNDDFKGGDLIGTLDMTATLR